MFIIKLQNYSATVINEVNLRQNILIKNSIRLSKYVRKTLFFTALRMKSIQHLVLYFLVNIHFVKCDKKLEGYFA